MAKNYYSIDSESLKCIRKWPSKRARYWSGEFIKNASKQANIKAVIVVGSAIRKVRHVADIDFIVIYDNNKPILNSPPIDVDIRAYDENQVQKLLSEGHDLLGWAIKLGCLVFERNNYWTKLRSQWINKLIFPSMEDARARANRAKKLYDELYGMGDKDAAEEQLITMLTHIARAHLIKAGIFPTSRPELPKQLREIGEEELAKELDEALERRFNV